MKKTELVNSHMNEKLEEAILFNVGQAHALNVVKYADSLKENQYDEMSLSSLDEWFDDFNTKHEFIVDTQVVVQNSSNDKIKFIRSLYRRVAILLFGVIVGASLLSLTSNAFRVNVYNLFIKTTQTFSEISYDDSTRVVELLNDLPKSWSGYYPSVLPLGYELDNSLENSAGKYLVFKNKTEQELILIQGSLGMKVLIDSEHAESFEVDINGLQGLIYEKSNLVTLLWNDNAVSFYLFGNLDKETIVKVALSIKYKK